MCEGEGRIKFESISFPNEAVYFCSIVRVAVFPVASWDVYPLCVGDDGVEVCY